MAEVVENVVYEQTALTQTRPDSPREPNVFTKDGCLASAALDHIT